MTSKANLSSRVREAKELAARSFIRKRDELGRPTEVRVPSASQRNVRYIVGLTRWESMNMIFSECQCPGNRGETVCKHVFAAIILSAEGRGQPAFCATQEDAKRRGRIDGRPVCVGGQGTGKVWVVMTRTDKVHQGRDEPSGYRALPHDQKPSGSGRMFK